MIKKVCQNCGKGVLKGHLVSHSKHRTRKFSKPNLHWHKIWVNGVKKKMLLCTKCLRTLKKKTAYDLVYKKPSQGQKSKKKKTSVKKTKILLKK